MTKKLEFLLYVGWDLKDSEFSKTAPLEITGVVIFEAAHQMKLSNTTFIRSIIDFKIK